MLLKLYVANYRSFKIKDLNFVVLFIITNQSQVHKQVLQEHNQYIDNIHTLNTQELQ